MLKIMMVATTGGKLPSNRGPQFKTADWMLPENALLGGGQ